jgi:hypothetical protein
MRIKHQETAQELTPSEPLPDDNTQALTTTDNQIPEKLDFNKLPIRTDYKCDPEKILLALHFYAVEPLSFKKSCEKAGISPQQVFAAMIDDPNWEKLYIKSMQNHAHIWVSQIDDIVTDNTGDIINTERETKDGRTFNSITINNANVKRADIRSKMYLLMAERLKSGIYADISRVDMRAVNVNANIDIPSSDLADLDVADLLRRNK